MQIEIKSTSYLLPENSLWDSLKQKNKLNFPITTIFLI